jgi:FdhD protein
MADCHQTRRVERWDNGGLEHSDDEVAQECAIALTYNGISHVVMMASPMDLEDFALGFSLTEEILQSADELYDLELHHHEQGIEVSMTIATQRIAELKQRRRNLTGRTGCGLCGAESLTEAIRPTKKVPKRDPIAHDAIQNALQQLKSKQPLQSITGAVHGAAWCDTEGNIHMLREDVGRHNALDKLIGAMSKANTNHSQGFALITSRASYEMVQKTTSMGISTLAAVSAPTTLAIKLAKLAGLNLVGFARPGRHITYT